jgi:hypothetical protein
MLERQKLVEADMKERAQDKVNDSSFLGQANSMTPAFFKQYNEDSFICLKQAWNCMEKCMAMSLDRDLFFQLLLYLYNNLIEFLNLS